MLQFTGNKSVKLQPEMSGFIFFKVLFGFAVFEVHSENSKSKTVKFSGLIGFVLRNTNLSEIINANMNFITGNVLFFSKIYSW